MGESIEYYTSLRSRRAAERADVALVVCDATAGITSQDLRIAELAMQSGCATALVLNKWDIAEDVDLDYERARAHQKLRLRPRVLTASAKTGRHVERLLIEAVALADRSRTRIPTPQLNRFLSEVVAARQPPVGAGGKGARSGHRLRLLFMTQTGRAPAAVLDPGQLPRPRHPRLRLLHREPAARALPAGGHAADHRLRRAQRAALGGRLRAAVARRGSHAGARLRARPGAELVQRAVDGPHDRARFADAAEREVVLRLAGGVEVDGPDPQQPFDERLASR